MDCLGYAVRSAKPNPQLPTAARRAVQRGRGLRLTRVRGVPLAGEMFGFGDLIPTYVAVKSPVSAKK